MTQAAEVTELEATMRHELAGARTQRFDLWVPDAGNAKGMPDFPTLFGRGDGTPSPHAEKPVYVAEWSNVREAVLGLRALPADLRERVAVDGEALFARRSVGWGGNFTPEMSEAVAVWGARAGVSWVRGKSEVWTLPDRQDIRGAAKMRDQLAAHLNAGALRRALRSAEERLDSGDMAHRHRTVKVEGEDRLVLWEDDMVRIITTTAYSYGYLHLAAYWLPAPVSAARQAQVR